MISRSLGPGFGGAVGMQFYLATTVASGRAQRAVPLSSYPRTVRSTLISNVYSWCCWNINDLYSPGDEFRIVGVQFQNIWITFPDCHVLRYVILTYDVPFIDSYSMSHTLYCILNYFSVVFVGVKYVNLSASGFLAITLTAIISIFIRNSS